MLQNLSARLNAVAELVPVCDTLADIGTDHGFLPLYLLNSKKIRRAVCADINRSPLESAKRNFSGTGLEAYAVFRLGNGMQVLSPGEADVAVIAGMGGDTIASLLAADESETPVFVLQPMSKTENLRSWLCHNGWGIEAWSLVADSGRLYEVLRISRSAPKAGWPFVRFGSPEGVDPGLYQRYLAEKTASVNKSLRDALSAGVPDGGRIALLREDLSALSEIQNNL